jgi:hypothetical protein
MLQVALKGFLLHSGVKNGRWSLSKNSDFIASVIPAQAGIQYIHVFLDAGSSPA